MFLIINNKKENFDSDKISFKELIEKKGLTNEILLTKLNGKLVKKEEREFVYISDNDNVILLHLIDGG